ncbi:amiloride-sensitive sodium channel subunit alpha-like [Montipora capricornis]|uniref:amiloride-sensitive sodium channel subunit alpha-like n=1 Tax=Montipora capricornis TaxID=246305 RepID=UPI0035F12835
MFTKEKSNDSIIEIPMENFGTPKNKVALATGSHEDLMKPGTDEDDDKQYSIRYLFLDFCEYTSGHGPPRILASKQLIRKIFWTVLFLAALVVSLWQISTLFEKFEARPLATHVAIQHETSLDFPVITICNFNSLRLSAIEELPEELRSDIETRVQELKKGGGESKRRKRATRGDPTPDPLLDTQFSEEEEEGFENPDALDSDFRSREELTMIMAQFDDEELIPFGQDFDALFVSCTYRGISCRNFSSVYWTRYWHYSYGNCYVFNGGKDKSGKSGRVLKSNKPGPLHGLVLELNIQQDEYLGAFAEEAGVRIDISNQGEMPFPREKGLSVAPGFATSIGIRKVEIIRKDPFNNLRCFNSTDLDDANLYKRKFRVGYSASACKESCLAFNQRKECNCIEYRFPSSDRTPICDILDRKTVRCLSRIQRAFKRNELNCTKSCPPPCRENLFQLTSSFSSWPSEGYQFFYSSMLEDKGIEFPTIENITSDLRSNVLKLNIFYEELNFELIREERSYEFANFMSDLGGSLGLWIGMSVLSFAEILELILLIGYALFVKLRRRLGGRIRSASQVARK